MLATDTQEAVVYYVRHLFDNFINQTSVSQFSISSVECLGNPFSKLHMYILHTHVVVMLNQVDNT